MKKINKILLVISGICGGLGVIFLISGFLTGVTVKQFWNAVSILPEEFVSSVEKHTEGKRAEDLDMKKWSRQEFSGIKKLDVNIGLGFLEIREYDGKKVEVYCPKNDTKIEIKQDGHSLKISQGGSIFGKEERPVKIFVPEDYIFNEIDLEIGAGEGVLDSLRADEINAEIGAGSLTAEGIVQAGKSDWTVGAGDLYLNHLISRKTELDCAVGEIAATLDGTEQDYRIKGSVGVGSLEIGGTLWDGLGQEVEIGDGSEKNRLSADCGTGEIRVDFAE